MRRKRESEYNVKKIYLQSCIHVAAFFISAESKDWQHCSLHVDENSEKNYRREFWQLYKPCVDLETMHPDVETKKVILRIDGAVVP